MPEPTDPARVTIDERVLALVPHYVLGLIAVPELDVPPGDPAVEALLAAAEDAVQAEDLDKAGVAARAGIAGWRDAYRAVGLNPNRFPCAAESIARRVAKGDRLPRINALVDLCNAVSLNTGLPVASCDLGDIVGDLDVRPADGSETFLPLGRPDAPEHPELGEVIYADAHGRAHSRRWNWRQGDVMATGTGPHRLLLTVEAADPVGAAEVDAALDQLSDALVALGVRQPHRSRLDRAAPTGAPFATGTRTPAGPS
ncbi:B3/B4 domain-containing protein [Cryptosporangium aurantiacum]|uniref:B3/B4 domain-containing protein (DNA/RNA-binding domain of Phe-tRNA-synthetase) n=1 Tax=Cryptosporangium aurantiacum TaxID=134849 RepID=A0A1M7P975_9ACTN|nr:phenylalanine--tRNA ligase beta subunit-related protein [Cryptosporangium aurantiacum]SHN13304.1 B3/B4 domain-containing protein (DNA/RNA-binding domain of Phe-tRNA-synthetase) [Cryptosporangium aurantiacum]